MNATHNITYSCQITFTQETNVLLFQPMSKDEMGDDVKYRGIVLTKKQLKEIFPEFATRKGRRERRLRRQKRKVRNFANYGFYKWPSTTVNYAFSGSQSTLQIYALVYYDHGNNVIHKWRI